MDFAQFIPSLELSLQETVSQKDKLQEIQENTIVDILKRSEEIHKSVDEVSRKMQENVKNIVQDEISRLLIHERQLREWIVWLKKENSEKLDNGDCQTSEKLTEDLPVNDSIRDSFLTTLHSLTQFEHTLVQFKAGPGTESLTDIFGSIDDYTVTLPICKFSGPLKAFSLISAKLLAKFECSEHGNVHAIAPLSNSKAWICSGWGNKTIALYTSDGKRKMSVTLNIPVDHMILTSKGDILISGYKEKVIKRLDEQLRVSTFANLSFIPRGMTLTDGGEVFVCGLKRNPSSVSTTEYYERSHIIAKFSSEGELLSEVIISPRDPHRMSLTPDGRICLSYLGRNNKRQVVIMDQTGNPEKIYTGKDPESEHTFYPLGTVCDRYGHIIVADWNSDRVHLLDKNGNFLQYLVTETDGFPSPSALAIDRVGNAWVGNATGCIRIYQYLI